MVTETSVPTSTPTATVDPCTSPPKKPKNLKPGKNKTVTGPALAFDWADSACATRYEIVVRRHDKTGPVVARDTELTVSEYTLNLVPTRSDDFVWRVRACNDAGCSKWTKWRHVDFVFQSEQNLLPLPAIPLLGWVREVLLILQPAVLSLR